MHFLVQYSFFFPPKRMQVCKPGSVSFKRCHLNIFYHLSMRPTHPGYLRLRRRIERVALKPGPIWPFNTRGLPNANITAYTCELLPHIFTITASLTSRLPCFCGTLCQNFLLGNMPAFSCGGSPYVARTFLPNIAIQAIEQPAFKFTDFLANGYRKIANGRGR